MSRFDIFSSRHLAFGLLAFLFVSPNSNAEENPEPVAWLVKQALDLDFQQIGESRSIYYLTSIAASCDSIQRPELSQAAFSTALKIANRNEKRSSYQTLFRYADAKEDLDLAREIATGAIQNRVSLLDRLDLLKYRLGDQEALKNYPRGEQTFYNAMELGQTYVELGQYERAEEYVTGIKISEENDPLSVTGLILRDIAQAYRKQGQQKLAEETIDKAFNIGGRLFYTGYDIEIAHRSIHGDLIKNLDQFATRGLRHRGHMGRELVSALIRELIQTKHFQQAKATTKYLDDTADRQQYLGTIAVAMVTHGHPGEAFETINDISDESAKTLARIQLSIALWERGELESSRNLIKFVTSQIDGKPFADHKEHYQALAELYGRTRQFEKTRAILGLAAEPVEQFRLIDKALKGYTSAGFEAKLETETDASLP